MEASPPPRGPPILMRSLASFPQAPCLSESILWGCFSGAVAGTLRFAFRRGHPHAARRAFFEGAVILGLTSGVAWVVCRRETHAKAGPVIEKLRKLKAMQDAAASRP